MNLFYRGLLVLLALQLVGWINNRFVGPFSSHSSGQNWEGTKTNYSRVPYVWVRSRNRAVDMTGHLHGPTMESPHRIGLEHTSWIGGDILLLLIWAMKELAGPSLLDSAVEAYEACYYHMIKVSSFTAMSESLNGRINPTQTSWEVSP